MCCGGSNIRYSMRGTIFDIKEFTVHDGPGPRITVFFKGCPLRCSWCHNPEGLLSTPQLMCRETLCSHCGACRIRCSHPECEGFDRCLHACPNGCITLAGQEYTVERLAQTLLRSATMLTQMGGGITFSGGEPLLQPDFVTALAQALGSTHKAIQTSGHADPEVYRRVVSAFDYVLQDIKLADPLLHERHTGVRNEWILQNIAWLKQSGKPFVFRVPLIPGITDAPENLMAIAEIAAEHPVELMPYNPLAGAKFPMVGMHYPHSGLIPVRKDLTGFFRHAVTLGGDLSIQSDQ